MRTIAWKNTAGEKGELSLGADTEKDILLLDSTLSIGGELIDWDYGENIIPNIRRLSVKSGLDIVEYGLLRKYSPGPDCAVYRSTVFPPGFEREEGQHYAVLLDRDFWPELSDIPDRGDSTADIVRVLITEERRDEELAYCAALAQKGYQVAALIDEIGQYGEDELLALLREMDTVPLWACCLFDASGVLDGESLHTVFSLCDQTLPTQIRIGFHGCDNLQHLFELAKSLPQMKMERGLCVEVSAGGIGAGALHLPARIFAEWMNGAFHRRYDVSILEFQETYTKQYVESKQEPGARLLYHATAEHKCSYRYAEHYCELSIDPSDQLGFYEEIEREFAFRFNKSAANRALMRYRKKRLDLVVVIPTANRPVAVDLLLYHAVQDLLCFGVDIVIYDSSDDERTRAITTNFQMDGYDNVYYRRYTGEFDGLSIDRKVMTAYSEYLDRDYIWLCRDGLIPTISQFYNELIELAEKGTEFIAVDWSNRNNNRHCVKNYDNCVAFFLDNAGRINTLGCSIFKGSFMKQLLHDRPLDESTYGFWVPIAPFHQMAAQPVSSGLIISNVFTYNPGGSSSSYRVKGMLKTWGENWYRTVSGLPAIYDPAKPSVLKVHTSDFRPFTLKSMLTLRSLNGFNLSVYREYRNILSHISVNPPFKFYFAALIPKSLAKLILNMENYWTSHPNSLFSKLISKLYHIYARLGR